MKEELKTILSPVLKQIDDIENERTRILEAKKKCVINKGYNGCWNCDVDESWCTVNQTMKMVEGKAKLLHVKFYNKVIEWIRDA